MTGLTPMKAESRIWKGSMASNRTVWLPLAVTLTACSTRLPAGLTSPEGGAGTVRSTAASIQSLAGESSEVTASRPMLVVLRGGSDAKAFAARIAAAGGRILGVDGSLDIASVEGLDATQIGRDPDVVEVRPDPPVPRVKVYAARTEDVAPPPPSRGEQPFQSLQWGLTVVKAPQAWATGDQGQGVKVAILDTGVDYTNPNLAPNLDLAESRSFIPTEGLMDLNGHGSHVAGIVAAARNGTGVAGVAPRAQLMIVKVLDRNAYGDDYGILEGIRYAADHHADVINLSLEDRLPWGTGSTGDSEMAYERAVRYATMNGSLVVAGVGNDFEQDRTSGWVHLPADLPLVLGVSAVGPVNQQNFDAFAVYSNWGSPMVQVAAPGGGIAMNPQTGPYIADPRDLVFSTWSTHAIPEVIDGIPLGPAPWSYMAGTSMSCAFASGVAAIAIAAHRDPPMAIAERIRRAAIGSGYNAYTGNGVVNALGVATQ